MITLNQSSRTYLGSKPAWYGATVVAASYPYLEGRCIGPRYVSNSALPARACTHAGTNSDGAASSFVRDTSVPGPGRAVQRGCVQTRRNLQLPRDPAAPLRTRPKISLAFRAFFSIEPLSLILLVQPSSGNSLKFSHMQVLNI